MKSGNGAALHRLTIGVAAWCALTAWVGPSSLAQTSPAYDQAIEGARAAGRRQGEADAEATRKQRELDSQTFGRAPPAQVAAVAPSPPRSERPSEEVCGITLLDKIGKSGVDQVRQMVSRRYKETIDGQVQEYR